MMLEPHGARPMALTAESLNNLRGWGRRQKHRSVAVKTAKELVRKIGLAVQPPQGVAIVLTEQPGALPNWVAAAGIMEVALTVKFSEKVAELMNTDPNVDWGEMDQGPGEARRVVTFLSEETD
jgi:hypothetical protein